MMHRVLPDVDELLQKHLEIDLEHLPRTAAYLEAHSFRADSTSNAGPLG